MIHEPVTEHNTGLSSRIPALDAALAAAAAGAYVLPIWPIVEGPGGERACACGVITCTGSDRGKHPHGRFAPNGLHNSTRDADVIRSWFVDGDVNIAVDLARSGLMAIDADGEGWETRIAQLEAMHGPLPAATVLQRSGSGAVHLFYNRPPFPIRGSIKVPGEKAITLRGANYCIIAPSQHARGTRYAWIDGHALGEVAPADLPPAWLEAIRRRETVDVVRVPEPADEPEWLRAIPDAERVARMRAYLEVKPGEVKGESAQGTMLAIACTAARGFAIRDAGAAHEALLATVNMRSEPPYAATEIARRVEAAYELTEPSWGAELEPHDERRRRRNLEMFGHAFDAPPANDARAVRRDVAEQATIIVTTDQHGVTNEAAAALAKLDRVYVRTRTLVHVVRDRGGAEFLTRPDGTPVIEALPRERLREYLAIAAQWWAIGKKGTRQTMVPPWVVETLLARGEWELPALEGIVDAPTMRPDGTILDAPGYDAATRLIYDPCGVSFPAVPDAPTQADAARALEELLEPFADFPFVGAAHRAAAAALVLSIIGRGAIEGVMPMFASGAPTPGSGKGLLVDVAATIATGRVASKMAHTADDNETRKRLLALAIESPALVSIDNVEGNFGGPALAMALTAGTVTDRILGASKQVTATLRPVWSVTGNNITYTGDVGRRIVPIDLDPGVEHPEDRHAFKHPRLLEYVRRERPRLVTAALTALRAFVVAGRPPHGKPAKGSFEAWDALIRGAILWAGGADPVAGVERIREQGDGDVDNLRALLAAWRDLYGDRAVTLGEVLDDARKAERDSGNAKAAALRDAVLVYGTRAGAPDVKALGYQLRKLRNRIAGGLKFEGGKAGKRGVPWRVVEAIG